MFRGSLPKALCAVIHGNKVQESNETTVVHRCAVFSSDGLHLWASEAAIGAVFTRGTVTSELLRE